MPPRKEDIPALKVCTSTQRKVFPFATLLHKLPLRVLLIFSHPHHLPPSLLCSSLLSQPQYFSSPFMETVSLPPLALASSTWCRQQYLVHTDKGSQGRFIFEDDSLPQNSGEGCLKYGTCFAMQDKTNSTRNLGHAFDTTFLWHTTV